MTLEEWLFQEQDRAEVLLLRNVSPRGALRGAIVASSSRDNPDYFYDWIRDSSISVKAILVLYLSASDREARRRHRRILEDFVDFTNVVQETAGFNGIGLGEPKFTVEGLPYTGPWARPQNDGAAIRAIELIRWAFILLDQGEEGLVRERLYNPQRPDSSPILRDLDYVARVWSAPCFDLWEEVWGDHFFTRSMIRKALLAGSLLARRLGDDAAVDAYREQAQAIADSLRMFWNPEQRALIATRNPRYFTPRSGLDTSVILATLGGYVRDEPPHTRLFPVDHEQVLATASVLEKVFASLYPINDPARGIPGIAIGRYPEDRYNGYVTDSLGNPWPGLTISMGWYYYDLAAHLRARSRITISAINLPFFEALPSNGLRVRPGDEILAGDPKFRAIIDAVMRRGDTFMERVRYHINPDGSMSEQMNRDTGFQQGARDLTMGYSAFLLTIRARLAPRI